jgi:hypothetical protein
MKFLGEFIQHFVSRFRNDVFLEDVSSGTIASGGNLGLDSNNKIVKADVPADGDITSVGFTVDDGSSSNDTLGAVNFSLLGGEGIDTSISAYNITISGEDASTSNKGVASFDNDFFTVSSGAVSIKSGGINLEDVGGPVTGTLPVSKGGTGADTLTDNAVLLGNGTSAIEASAHLSYTSPSSNSDYLKIGDSNTTTSGIITHSAAPLVVQVGESTGTNAAGSDITFIAGQSTGNTTGGDIIFKSSNLVGSSGSAANSLNQIAKLDNVGNLEINGGFTGGSLSTISTSGNAATATALATSRDLQVDLTSTSAQGFTGAANATSIGVSGALPVTNGGTGSTSLTDNSILTGAGSSAITAEANFTYDGSDVLLQSTAGNKPDITLKATGNHNKSPVLQFVKDKGAAGAASDAVGTINFEGDNDAQQQTPMAGIVVQVEDATDGSEEGKFAVSVKNTSSTGTSDSFTLTGNGTATDASIGSGSASVTTIAGNLTVTSDLTVNGDTVTFQSANADDPHVLIKNTNNGTNEGARLDFNKLRADDGVEQGQNLGEIHFTGQDSAQNTQSYGYIIGEIDVGTSGQESGQIVMGVANHDGGQATGFKLTGGSQNDEIDAEVGFGTSSVTTIAGTLTMGSTAALDNSGVLQVGAQTNITSLGTLTSGLNIGSASYTGDGVTVTGSDSDNTYDVFVGKRKFPRIRLIDDAATGDTEFQIWNLGDELRIGTSASTHGNAALVIHDGNAALVEVQDDLLVNGEIQLGNASDTTIARSAAGTVTIEGKEVLTNDSGTVTVSAGTSGDATLIIEADTDDNNEDDLPRLWFRADTINEGAIQLQDNTLDIINNVSASGGIRFLTGTTNNTGTTDPSTSATERMSISSQGLVTVAGALQSNTIELGHASDTTIARSSAGKVRIEGEAVVTTLTEANASGITDTPIATKIARRTLTTAEMNSLHTTPIQIIPAQGTNVVALPAGGMIRVDRASTNNNGGALNFHYEGLEPASFGTDALVHIRRFHTSQTTDAVYNLMGCTPFGGIHANSLTEDVNKAIEVSLDAACTTDCFTSVDVYLMYQLIKIA